MEHSGNKSHCWWLIWIILCKLKCQLKRTSIPRSVIRPKNNSIPKHYVVVIRSTADASWRILLQPLEIPHQSFPRWRRHPPHHCN
nr:Os05g0182550 [Ipomoea batatas]GME01875.1 Os05g0182550 [Ipomoea batatas]